MASRTISTVNTTLPGARPYIGPMRLRIQIRISPQRTRARRCCAARWRLLPARARIGRLARRLHFNRICQGFERTWPKTSIDTGADGERQDEIGAAEPPEVGVIAQYVKDLSFENPNAPAVFQWQAQPQMDVQFNIGTQPAGQDLHEVVAEDRGQRPGRPRASPSRSSCSTRACSCFAASRPSSCSPSCSPRRRACSSPSRARSSPTPSVEGGFPPLRLDPIDFGGLYMQSAAQAQAEETGGQAGDVTGQA